MKERGDDTGTWTSRGDDMELEDVVLGCLVGGALGDGLGGRCEGLASGALVDLAGPWELSDDTQLTLATCEAIGPGGRIEPEDLVERLLAWWRVRRFRGLGASTLKSLVDLDAGAHWASAGRRGERAAGNGAAMRAAPLAFVVDPAGEAGRRLLRDLCWITHHSDEAYVGALAIVWAIQAMRGRGPTRATGLSAWVADRLPDSNVRDALRRASEFSPKASVHERAALLGRSGYVAESVPFAIAAVETLPGSSFEQVLVEIVEAGGDTDTNASLAGQIMGTALGFHGLPPRWVARLEERELVVVTVQELARRLDGR
ncbi:MAG: ADP-ribosylglycohydrolase family protein [Planctomycetes bacterium]|nr:ADP-ribosylglycohydrolase family protein [Planctomycetota bacterium]